MSLREKLKNLPGAWEYLYCLCFLGLRPSGLDWLLAQVKTNQEPIFDSQANQSVPVLRVYQAKLVMLPHERRYKYIHLFLPEMVQAVSYIESGTLKRPLGKTLKKRSGNPKLHLYGDRKAFFVLLTKVYHQDPLQVSRWLVQAGRSRGWRIETRIEKSIPPHIISQKTL